MKYYSDLLDKMFNSLEECESAEDAYNKELKEKENQIKEETQKASKEKKIISNKIEEADKNLDLAYNDYEIAKNKVKELLKESDNKIKDILDEYNNKAMEILNPAKQAIKTAQEEKFKALSEFNKKFGTYTINYTGDKAYNEYKRISSWINEMFNRFF